MVPVARGGAHTGATSPRRSGAKPAVCSGCHGQRPSGVVVSPVVASRFTTQPIGPAWWDCPGRPVTMKAVTMKAVTMKVGR